MRKKQAPRRSQEEQKQLVQDNLGLVGFVLDRIWDRSHRQWLDSWEDAFQLGVMALADAARCWDETRQVSFGTYAYRAIHMRLIKCIGVTGLIRTPRNESSQKHLVKLQNARRWPCEITEIIAKRLLQPEPECLDYSVLYQVLARLPEKEQQLLHLYFWEGKTFKEAGVLLGLSRQAAHQLMGRILKRLQPLLRCEYDTP